MSKILTADFSDLIKRITYIITKIYNITYKLYESV